MPALVLMLTASADAAPIRVRYAEAPSHAFLVLTDLAGKTLAGGELVQWQDRRGLANRLVFRFADGSLYDETVRFSARSTLRLTAYRLVQRGPSFPERTEVEFDRSGRYAARTWSRDGKEEHAEGTLDVPEDAYNGMLSTLLKNLGPAAGAIVHLLAFTPSPTRLEATLAREGDDAFSIAQSDFVATRFVVTPKVVGVKGAVASLVGKQPEPRRFWLTKGNVPTFVRFEGPLYNGGPSWRIELAPARWKR